MKRRGHGEGSLYQRDDGSWRAMTDLGWHDGKRVRRSVSGKTRREVVEKLTVIRRRMEAGLQPPVSTHMRRTAVFLCLWLLTACSSDNPAFWQSTTLAQLLKLSLVGRSKWKSLYRIAERPRTHPRGLASPGSGIMPTLATVDLTATPRTC
jgi:hypothetical protein